MLWKKSKSRLGIHGVDKAYFTQSKTCFILDFGLLVNMMKETDYLNFFECFIKNEIMSLRDFITMGQISSTRLLGHGVI